MTQGRILRDQVRPKLLSCPIRPRVLYERIRVGEPLWRPTLLGRLFKPSIFLFVRDQVAQVAVEAIATGQANDRTIEVVSRPDEPERDFGELFGSLD